MKKLLFALTIASLWSFSEIILKAEMISIQYHSALLTSLAFGFLILFYSVFKDIKYIMVITIATICIKCLSVPIQDASFSGLTNSLLAIGLDGLIITGMLLILKGKHLKYKSLIILGFSSAIVVAFLFRIIGFHLTPCTYFESFAGLSGIFRFIYTEGLIWAIFAAVSVPIFHFIGTSIHQKINNLYLNNQKIYYISFSMALILSFSSNIIALIF